jgi:diguanylate cyclase (GGDEF)-like protein/PAS domain S-box-containing protein
MEAEGRSRGHAENDPLSFDGRSEESAGARNGSEPPAGGADQELSFVSRSGLFDRVGALVIILDRQGRICWFNRVCRETTGLSFQEVWGKYVWEALALEEEADLVKGVLEKLRTGRFTAGYESHLRTREGEMKIIQWSIAPLLDGEGPVEHIAGVGVDVTDRKRTEERLRTSEEHYRGLVESSPDAIFVHHRGKIVFSNRAGAMLLGASDPGQIIDREVLDFIHPDARPVVEARLQKALAHDTELALFEDRLVRLDGSEVRVDAHSIFPFMYQDKPAVQVVAREVTDARKTEEELFEQQQRSETLLRISSDAVMETDLRGRITSVSRRVPGLFGFEAPDELIGRSTFELILPEDHEEFIKNLQKTFREGVVSGIELSLLKRDGSHFEGRLNMALLREGQGKPKGFLTIARDVAGERPGLETWPKERAENSETTALLEASRAVLVYRDFEPAARAIFEACKNLIGASVGYVGRMNEDGTRDNVLYSDPEDFPWGEHLARSRRMRELRAEAYLTAEVTYLNDLSGAARGEVERAEFGHIQNVLFAPLSVQDNTVGLLVFANKVGGFTDEDARMASAFGELAAVSLESSRALQALELSEERFRSVAETTGDAIVTFDADEHIVYWNPGAEAIFGHRAEEMMGKRLTLVAPADLREAYKNAVNEVESGGAPSSLAQPVEMIGRRKDGSTFPLELSFAGWTTRNGVFLTSVIRDITERKLAEHDLRLLADHDHLTGLPNRALLRDHLTQALAAANREPQKLAVMMVDLDHFKAVNHEYGSQAGDQLLQAVGDRLTGLVRTADTVARSGDDEFTLLLLGIEAAQNTDRVAERIIQALRQPFALNGREVLITASIGVALYPDDGEDVETLIRGADLAMSQVKEEGRDNYKRLAGQESDSSEEQYRSPR